MDTGVLLRFLQSPLAEEIRSGANVLREYRFTLLMDAKEYDPAANGNDEMLLQGVVDCCFEENGGITVETCIRAAYVMSPDVPTPAAPEGGATE